MRQTILIISILIAFSTAIYADMEPAREPSDQGVSKHVVMAGASYLKGWQLKKIACLPVFNKGVSGETSTQVRERFEADVISTKPVAVIIWGHINDFSNAPKNRELQTRETAIDNLKYMLEISAEHGVIPIVATEITFGMPDDMLTSIKLFIGKLLGKRSHQDYISSNVSAVNDWIRSYAKQHGISVLEIAKLMTNEKGYRKKGYFTDDLSHITQKAYDDLQEFAQPILRKSLIEKHGLCN